MSRSSIRFIHEPPTHTHDRRGLRRDGANARDRASVYGNAGVRSSGAQSLDQQLTGTKLIGSSNGSELVVNRYSENPSNRYS